MGFRGSRVQIPPSRLSEDQALQRLSLWGFFVARACTWSGFLQGDQDRGKGGDKPSGRGEPLAFPVSSRMNADDRLPRASFGRVEGGDGIVEGGDGADVRAQPSVPHSLNDLAQLGAIGFNDDFAPAAAAGA